MNENPLTSHFRRPAIHMTLPSKGLSCPNSVKMPETNELPVYPMTGIDEITYRTPDALLNGSAIVDIIRSCIPAIVDPWSMSSDDLNAVLIAIRIASVGHTLEINTQCPKCKTVDTYEVDLRIVGDMLKAPDYSVPLEVGSLRIFFKSLTYKNITESTKLKLEEEMMNKIIANSELSEDDKIHQLSKSFKKVSDFTFEAIIKNIELIETEDAQVTDVNFIKEYLQNCDRAIYTSIKEKIVELRSVSNLKPISIACDKCKHEYEQPFTLDMSDFFE